MRKDIHIPKVEDVSMAVVKETGGENPEWGVYLINQKAVDIDNIIIASKGYGVINEQEVKHPPYASLNSGRESLKKR